MQCILTMHTYNTHNTYRQYIQAIHTYSTYIQYTYIQYTHTVHAYNTYIQYIHTILTYNTYIQYIHTYIQVHLMAADLLKTFLVSYEAFHEISDSSFHRFSMTSFSQMLLNHVLCFTLELCTSNQDQRDFLFFIAVGYYKLGVSSISFERFKFVFQERLRKKLMLIFRKYLKKSALF